LDNIPTIKDKKATETFDTSKDAEDEEVQTRKAIEKQFKELYEGDSELRKVLEKSDVNSFGIEEKYQIIEAYMQGGGA